MRFAAMAWSLVVVVTVAAEVDASGVRDARPNLVYGELGGRAALLSVGYERYLTQRVGVGAGILGFGDSDGAVTLVPLYVSFIPVGDTHSLYLSGGATYRRGGSWHKNWGTWFGTLSVGYQYHSEGGFFVRPLVTTIHTDDGVFVFPGITVGGSF